MVVLNINMNWNKKFAIIYIGCWKLMNDLEQEVCHNVYWLFEAFERIKVRSFAQYIVVVEASE